MPGTLIALTPQNRIGPLEIVERRLFTLPVLSRAEDTFQVLTASSVGVGSVLGILNGRLEMHVCRGEEGELWFLWRVTELEGTGTLSHLSIHLPGPYHGGVQMFGGSFRDEAGSDEPSVFTFDGQRVSFNLYAPGETLPGIKSGQTSRTYFIRTTATWWVPGGRVRYTAQRGSGNVGTMPGSALGFQPFVPDERFTGHADGPVHLFGGIEAGGPGFLWTPGGGFTPVPPPRPDAIASRLAELAHLQQAATAWASPALAETIHHEVQQELTALSQLRSDKQTAGH